jgi:MFS family permease
MTDVPSLAAGRNHPATRSQRFSRALCALGVLLFWSSLYLYMPTLPTYVQSKAESLALVGVILAQYGLWQAVLRLPLGITVDWTGRRKPFILVGIALGGLGAWVLGTADSAGGLLIGRAITGMGAATWVPMTVLFSSLFPPYEAVRATSLLSLTAQVARLGATSVTGSLNEWGGTSAAFFVAAAVAGLGVVVMLFLREQPRTPRRPSPAQLGRLFSRRDVLIPSLMSAVTQYATWALPLGFLPILAKEMGAGNVALSVLTTGYLAMVALGSFLSATLAHRVRARSLVVACIVLLASGCGLAALAPALPLVFLGQLCLGLAQGSIYPLLMGLSIRDVADQERTAAMGLHQAVYAAGMFAGPWLSGILAEAIGLQPMVAATGGACLVAGLVLVRMLPATPRS